MTDAKTWDISDGAKIEVWAAGLVGIVGTVAMSVQVYAEWVRSQATQKENKRAGRKKGPARYDGKVHHYTRRALIIVGLLFIFNLAWVVRDMSETRSKTQYFLHDFAVTNAVAVEICTALYLVYVLFQTMFVSAMLRVPENFTRTFMSTAVSVPVLSPIINIVRAVTDSDVGDACLAIYIMIVCWGWGAVGGYSLLRVNRALKKMEHVRRFSVEQAERAKAHASPSAPVSSDDVENTNSSDVNPGLSPQSSTSLSSESNISVEKTSPSERLRRTTYLYLVLMLLVAAATAEQASTMEKRLNNEVPFYPDSDEKEDYEPNILLWCIVLAYAGFSTYCWGPVKATLCPPEPERLML